MWVCMFSRSPAARLMHIGRSGDGTIADPHSCVGEDGRTYQGYMPGGEETEPCPVCSILA